MERQNQQIMSSSQRCNRSGRAGDLLCPRQKREHVTAFRAGFDVFSDGIGDAVHRRDSTASSELRTVLDVDREGSTRHAKYGAAVEELRNGFGIERGGHDNEDQIFAGFEPYFTKQGDGDIGVNASLMKF